MKLKWEKNSRVMELVSQGKIDYEDVIPRTKTELFPFEAATVRLRRVRDKRPFVTVHIRGKATKSQWGGYYGPTCRVNFGGAWQGTPMEHMDSNGQLEQGLTWLDVHKVVEKTKLALGFTNEKEKSNKNDEEGGIWASEKEASEEASEEVPEWLPLKEIDSFEKSGWKS